MSHIAALILAAGGSTRMGCRKQLLQFEGQTLLSRTVEAVTEAGFSPTVVVLGCEAQSMRAELADSPSVRAVENTDWMRGIGSSIREGMNGLIELDIKASAVLIALADQPHVTASTLGRMNADFRKCGRPVCASSYSGTVGPPVIVSRLFFPKLLALPDDQGAKRIWLDNPDVLALFPCDEGGFDIDTPADYQKLSDRCH